MITSVNSTTISTADGLTNVMSTARPGQKFTITYVDQYGTRHTATATLAGWAK